MKTKEILEMMVSLIQGRMNDLESRDLLVSNLNCQIEIQRRLIRLIAELSQERFSENEAVFKEIVSILESDKSEEAMKKVLNRELMARDQMQAMLADFKTRVERLADD